MSEDRTKKRIPFDSVADLYDRIRPAYPEEMISDLLKVVKLRADTRVIELGPGTGQLTSAIAGSGSSILALELGRNLANIARRRLVGYTNVRVEVGDFNEYDFEEGSADVVVAATSYHWLDPFSRVVRIARVLRNNGILVLIDTHHVNGGTELFFSHSQSCYRKWDVNTTEEYHLPEISEVVLRRWESELSKYFSTVISRTYDREVEYSAPDYVSLLRTYSDVIAMDDEHSEGLLECINSLIVTEFRGKIRKKYLTELYVAKKKK